MFVLSLAASFCVHYSLFIYMLPLWCVATATVLCTRRSPRSGGGTYFHCRRQDSACACTCTSTTTSHLISSPCLLSHDTRGQNFKPLCICCSEPPPLCFSNKKQIVPSSNHITVASCPSSMDCRCTGYCQSHPVSTSQQQLSSVCSVPTV